MWKPIVKPMDHLQHYVRPPPWWYCSSSQRTWPENGLKGRGEAPLISLIPARWFVNCIFVILARYRPRLTTTVSISPQRWMTSSASHYTSPPQRRVWVSKKSLFGKKLAWNFWVLQWMLASKKSVENAHIWPTIQRNANNFNVKA